MDIFQDKEKEKSLMKLLSEIGFLCMENGLTKEGREIFEGLRAVRPESDLPLIGLASVEILKGDCDAAIKIIEKEALKVKPDSDLAKAYLGMCYKLKGHSGNAERILKEVVDHSKEEEAVSIATNMLSAK